MKSWITAISIAVLTSLVCALLVATNEESPGGDGDRAAAPLARPAKERSASVSSGAQAVARDDDASPGEPAAPPSSQASQASQASPPAPSSDEVRDQIGGSFKSERVDTSWDGVELARLEKALPALLPAGSQINRVECRATMCRIESTHPSIDRFADFARAAFMMENRVNEGPFFASVTAPPVAGQPVTTVAYIARKGHILPMPERIATAQ
jgi:hypothetical protein